MSYLQYIGWDMETEMDETAEYLDGFDAGVLWQRANPYEHGERKSRVYNKLLQCNRDFARGWWDGAEAEDKRLDEEAGL